MYILYAGMENQSKNELIWLALKLRDKTNQYLLDENVSHSRSRRSRVRGPYVQNGQIFPSFANRSVNRFQNPSSVDAVGGQNDHSGPFLEINKVKLLDRKFYDGIKKRSSHYKNIGVSEKLSREITSVDANTSNNGTIGADNPVQVEEHLKEVRKTLPVSLMKKNYVTTSYVRFKFD